MTIHSGSKDKKEMNFTHKDLPLWLQEAMPNVVEDFIIRYAETEGYFYLNDEAMTTFNTLDDAYKYVNNNGFHFVFDSSILQWCEWCEKSKAGDINTEDFEDDDNEEFTPSKNYLSQLQENFYQKYGDEHINKKISYKNNQGEFSVLFENSRKEDISETVREVKYFEEVTAKAYHKNPNNFIYAHAFINHHPMFWFKQELSNGKTIWIDDAGVEGLSVYFYNEDENDDDSAVVCVIETGEHVAPNYDTRYFSPLLTVKGSSYEQAIIKCAARLAKFYEDDGTAKEGYLEQSTQASNDYVNGTYSIEE